MFKPRCGMPDKMGASTDSRSKRFVLFPSKWRKSDLTYKILNGPRNGLSHVPQQIDKAFSLWSQRTNLKFSETDSDTADFKIQFLEGDHHDKYPFDGPNNVLAHAFYPKSGVIHFDDSEQWVIGNKENSYDILQTAAHEIGHALGLAHSRNRSALMKPYYEHIDIVKLSSDDINVNSCYLNTKPSH